ncbi:hypothetical protein Taro_038838 [Colocasia esculenta]|uniref:Uncharacterized protein n=1 Tax=Colocasia esculenta TaxID=4460 RepID=A0A843WKE6_COLES|nr:hypothetical protein [Colocasia esculenta]
MSATSASQRTEISCAFFSSPDRRLEKVTCRLILFSILFSCTFPLPIGATPSAAAAADREAARAAGSRAAGRGRGERVDLQVLPAHGAMALAAAICRPSRVGVYMLVVGAPKPRSDEIRRHGWF